MHPSHGGTPLDSTCSFSAYPTLEIFGPGDLGPLRHEATRPHHSKKMSQGAVRRTMGSLNTWPEVSCGSVRQAESFRVALKNGDLGRALGPWEPWPGAHPGNMRRIGC